MKYRKKPLEVDALIFEYTKDGIDKLKSFVGSKLGDITKERRLDAKAEAVIRTLEDGSKFQVAHIATEGDYIIKGIQGEFYPCKPDIFEQTYELVLNEQNETEESQRSRTSQGNNKEVEERESSTS